MKAREGTVWRKGDQAGEGVGSGKRNKNEVQSHICVKTTMNPLLCVLTLNKRKLGNGKLELITECNKRDRERRERTQEVKAPHPTEKQRLNIVTTT